MKTPPTVEGKSLVPVIKGEQVAVRDSVFTAYRHFQRAVRTSEWKLILYKVNGTETVQLFNMGQDPLEKMNLAGDPAQSKRIDALRAMLGKWQREVDDPVNFDH